MSINDCNLQPNRIDLWEFPLDKLPVLTDSVLNENELARANRFYFERHKRRFKAARATLRLILSRYLQIDANQLQFTYNNHGKPELHHQAIEFNLSHSHDLALLAVGQQFPLGVDLEFFSARSYDGIANHLFSQQELRSFLKLPFYLKPQAFFQVWAQKEAFIKACGMGLAYPTQRFNVPLLAYTPALIPDPINNKEWQLVSFMPRIACSAALCHHPDIQEIRYISLNNEHLP